MSPLPPRVLSCLTHFPSQDERAASPSDDIHALAASFFHVMFEKEPFPLWQYQAKQRGLNWDGVDLARIPCVADFLDKATHPDPA